jgi:site-specific recombinase XerC
MRETDVREGWLHVAQGKTSKRLRIKVVGELATVLERIRARKRGHRIYATALIVSSTGRPVGLRSLQARWAAARTAAGLPKGIQYRDLRAKAGTDKAATHGNTAAQRQLGHAHAATTEIYIRDRLADEVTPTR